MYGSSYTSLVQIKCLVAAKQELLRYPCLCSICLFRLFLIFLPCVSEVLTRGTVALDDRKVLLCVLPLVLCYVLLVNKWID